MGKVISRNRREVVCPDCCHSHDFCDANVFMDKAFIKVIGKSAATQEFLNDDKMLDLWDSAWTKAKKSGFTLHQRKGK